MDFIKDIYEAWGARIKSNVFGSIAIAFVFVNWKVLFFLLFADVRVETKFNYFDANTDWLSLYVFPLCFGSVLALGLPFTNDWVHRVVSKPVSRVRSREDELAHQRLKQKNEWEEERIRERELYAESLISQAQIDQDIDSKVEDPEKRKEIRAKIEESQKSVDLDEYRPESDDQSELSNIEQIILIGMSKLDSEGFRNGDSKNPIIFSPLLQGEVSNLTDARVQSEVRSALGKFLRLGLAQKDLYGLHTLTSEGYALADQLDPESYTVARNG